jgi:shikimate kinase
VILIGFMGAGKSCVGRALAAALGWAFEDLDDRIEENAGRTIAEVFRESGEAEFRRLEHAALKSLAGESGLHGECVIALGGGAFIQEANSKLIEAWGVPTIFLDAEVEELWNRCQGQALDAGSERPLLKDREQFRALYELRRPHYLKASLRQETGGKPVAQVAAELIRAVKLKRSRSEGDKK